MKMIERSPVHSPAQKNLNKIVVNTIPNLLCSTLLGSCPTRKDWIRTEVYISGKHASLFCQLVNNVSEYFIAKSPGQTEERQGQQETLETYTINFFTTVNKFVM